MIEKIVGDTKVTVEGEPSLSWAVSGSGVNLKGERAHSLLLVAAADNPDDDGAMPTVVEGFAMATNDTVIQLVARAIVLAENQFEGVTAERIMAYFIMRFRAGIAIEPSQMPSMGEIKEAMKSAPAWPGIFPGASDPSVN